jgi:hypothetical protein
MPQNIMTLQFEIHCHKLHNTKQKCQPPELHVSLQKFIKGDHSQKFLVFGIVKF